LDIFKTFKTIWPQIKADQIGSGKIYRGKFTGINRINRIKPGTRGFKLFDFDILHILVK